jgi:CHAT domain-containing protein/tetratricopeptide (TPR) repeat protein
VDAESHLEQLISAGDASDLLAAPLPDELAAQAVDRLKQEADRHWYIDPHRSLELAERIVAIGQARHDLRQAALGTMARGDALKFVGRTEEAWQALEQAGAMFQSAGDEVGWARTRIGRLSLSTMLKTIPGALADAEQARAILTRHGENDKLVRLHLQTAYVHYHLGDPRKALELFQLALTIADALGEAGQQYLGPLCANIGSAYGNLGDFRQALAYYERARSVCVARDETLTLASIETNIALILQAQGHYRKALQLLHVSLEHAADRSPLETAKIKWHLVECYLALNRQAEARDLSRQVAADFRTFNDSFELARSLLYLATAEAALENTPAAQTALDEAEAIFASLGATTWVATTWLRRGRIALHNGNAAVALQAAVDAGACFELQRQQVNVGMAALLQGQASLAAGYLPAAATAGGNALRMAQRLNVPALRYSAHLLLGQVAEARNETTRAMRGYRAATATVERVQRGLSITLQPGFLEDKGEAWQALIRLHLQHEQIGEAFETLERAKSQVLLGYLANRERLQWAQDDPRSQALIEELNELRAEHQWFYHLAHETRTDSDEPAAMQPDQALDEVAARERRMRVITERLYLHSGDRPAANPARVASVQETQAALEDETLMVEYFDDGVDLWAFTLDGMRIEAHRLPVQADGLRHLLAGLQTNLAAALNLDPQSQAVRPLTHLAKRILQRLASGLIEPLALAQRGRQRLVIVPYGALHYLPFHLLHNGSTYLIEQHEVVILPAAALVTLPSPQRQARALILAHSRDGRLPHTLAEAEAVQRLLGGALHTEQAASRSALKAPPVQILHIAAHGQHRPDQPDLSYLQLADGQMYTDDLLQQDLSYELVTLSACETGRANVAAGEELIGLGRGFLYAGAGSLILSLWPVADATTVGFMQNLYSQLRSGATKASAVREAQRRLLADNVELHPAYWGAFQLVGHAGPLSSSAN